MFTLSLRILRGVNGGVGYGYQIFYATNDFYPYDLTQCVITAGHLIALNMFPPLLEDDEDKGGEIDMVYLVSLLATEEYYISPMTYKYMTVIPSSKKMKPIVIGIRVIPGELQDRLVLSVLSTIVMSSLYDMQEKKRYFSKSCFSDFTTQGDRLNDLHNEILGW